MSEIKKSACPQCPRTDVSVVSGGVLRAHAANSKKITPENPACPGSGGNPAGADTGEPPTEHTEGQAKCKECRMPYPLTSNGRIRSHLDRGAPAADGTQPNCPGGSDWPLGVEGLSADPTPDQELEMARRRAGGALAELDRFKADLPHDRSSRETHYVEGLNEVHMGTEEACTRAACAHVHEYAYMNDNKGHSGSFCVVCGRPEPENPSEAARSGAVVHTLPPVGAAEAFLTGSGRPAAPVTDAEAFLTGDSDPEPERRAAWFSSRYDGDCSNCSRHFDSGDEIRADGDGGWEARECCGEDDDLQDQAVQAAAARRAAVSAKPKHTSLQLPVRNGRYRAPHPESGKDTPYTRTTTFAEAIADSIALDQWKGRMEAMGLALRPDLMAKVRSIVQGREPYLVARLARDDLNAIVEDAKLAAGSKERAKKGTILHKHTEEIDSGRRALADVPDEFHLDVRAYLAMMEKAGFRPVKHLIERSVLTTELGTGVVGTFDRVLEVIRDQEPMTTQSGRTVRLVAGDYVIGDVKSGASLDFAWGEIEIQESIYAHAINENGVASPVYDEDGKPHWTWSSLAEQGIKPVREDIGIVMHMPYGEGRCELYPADLVEGWRGAKLCAAVRDFRKVKLPAPVAVADTGILFTEPVSGFPLGAEHDPAAALAVVTVDESRAYAGYARPSAAQMTTGHPSVAAPAEPTWDDKFRSVRTKEDASSQWAAAKAAGLPADELARLVAVAREVLKRQEAFSGPNTAPVTQPAAPAPAEAPAPPEAVPAPTLEERAAAVTTKAEASAIFQEMKASAAKVGMTRINAVTRMMQEALGAR
jgi:hypothetical protein